MLQSIAFKVLGLATAGLVTLGVIGSDLPGKLASASQIAGDGSGRSAASQRLSGRAQVTGGGHIQAPPDRPADPVDDGHPVNHGFFVSQIARGITTTVPGVTLPVSPKNHGEVVRTVARSDVGKPSNPDQLPRQGKGK